MDSISRQAAIDEIEQYIAHLRRIDKRRIRVFDAMLMDIKAILEQSPSAEPQIIRRKDCKHYQFADNRAFGMPGKMCEWFGFEDVDDDDFCSRAERRVEHNG